VLAPCVECTVYPRCGGPSCRRSEWHDAQTRKASTQSTLSLLLAEEWFPATRPRAVYPEGPWPFHSYSSCELLPRVHRSGLGFYLVDPPTLDETTPPYLPRRYPEGQRSLSLIRSGLRPSLFFLISLSRARQASLRTFLRSFGLGMFQQGSFSSPPLEFRTLLLLL